MGDSLPQMLGNPEVAKKITDDAFREFETELDRAVYRVLMGWR